MSASRIARIRQSAAICKLSQRDILFFSAGVTSSWRAGPGLHCELRRFGLPCLLNRCGLQAAGAEDCLSRISAKLIDEASSAGKQMEA